MDIYTTGNYGGRGGVQDLATQKKVSVTVAFRSPAAGKFS